MRTAGKKEKLVKRNEDDSLFGLLSSYKSFNTYFRIMVSESKNSIIIHIADNPKKWPGLDDDRYKDYSVLKRSDLNLNKFFVKYLSPAHLIDQIGHTLGIKLPDDRVVSDNRLEIEGYFSLETALEFREDVIQGINKLINLNPQKKYEILEKSLSENV